MGRTIVFSSVLLTALLGFGSVAYAGDGEDEEIVTTKGKKADGKVQVIIVQGDNDDPAPRRRRERRRRKIEAVDGEKAPAGYHTEYKSYRGLWIGGISMFASSYFLTVISGAIADAAEGHGDGQYTWYSLIPAAGPFVIAGHSEIQVPAKVWFIALGAIETAGLGMFIGGLASKKEVWVSDEAKLDPELYIGAGTLGLRQRF